MNCYFHPDTPAVAFCRSCGRPLCVSCQRPAEGTVFCQEHLPAAESAPPQQPLGAAAPNPYYTPPAYQPPLASAPSRTSPGAAFWLGLIPGVGAIYNGQYMKGLVHAVITGLLMSVANAADNTAGEPFIAMILTAFWFYMAFEAYHTAKKRQLGVPVEEWSSLLGPAPQTGRVPIGPITLIGIGVIFLLDTLHILDFRDFGRFWPVLLILVGAYLLYSRLTTPARIPPPYASNASTPPAADRVGERP
jgi:LiaI-LiaF-like transmembrane region/B-box zinc finger